MKALNQSIIISSVFAIATPLVILPSAIATSSPKWNAEITRTCAPWDGPAFRVELKERGRTTKTQPTILVSIWQAPDFSKPVSFNLLPNSSTGVAEFRNASGSSQFLKGKVTFRQMRETNPVEGQFNFVTPQGQRKQGTFKAIWKPKRELCG